MHGPVQKDIGTRMPRMNGVQGQTCLCHISTAAAARRSMRTASLLWHTPCVWAFTAVRGTITAVTNQTRNSPAVAVFDKIFSMGGYLSGMQLNRRWAVMASNPAAAALMLSCSALPRSCGSPAAVGNAPGVVHAWVSSTRGCRPRLGSVQAWVPSPGRPAQPRSQPHSPLEAEVAIRGACLATIPQN